MHKHQKWLSLGQVTTSKSSTENLICIQTVKCSTPKLKVLEDEIRQKKKPCFSYTLIFLKTNVSLFQEVIHSHAYSITSSQLALRLKHAILRFQRIEFKGTIPGQTFCQTICSQIMMITMTAMKMLMTHCHCSKRSCDLRTKKRYTTKKEYSCIQPPNSLH